MPYRLKSQESLSTGINRIANEQIDASVYQLTTSIEANRAKAIHTARKHFKKMRALVRLVRDEVGKDAYKTENICFRDAGRQLSDVRDAQVRIETLDKLLAHYQDFIEVERFNGIRQVLIDAHEAVRQAKPLSEGAIATLVSDLKRAQSRIQTWPLRNDWATLQGGLHRVYKRGHAGFFAACEQPTPDHLHDWRKRVKYLWYHLRILSPLWPTLMQATKTQMKELSDLLGDDHDLTVLRDFIIDDPEAFDDDDQLGILLALMQHRQLELQTQARFLGQRLYAEKSKAFTSRLEQYWKAWQGEQEHLPAVLQTASDYVHNLPTAYLHS